LQICLKVSQAYSGDEEPPTPLLKVRLYDPTRRDNLGLEAKVDTGFSGSLLITLDHYLKLGLQRYEEPQKAETRRLATGLGVQIRASKGVLEVGSVRVNCAVYTTPILVKPLLGRELMNEWRLLLDGPKKRLDVEL